MRCGRCGNENAEGNRFCGMCGTPLVAKVQPPAQAHASGAASAAGERHPTALSADVKADAEPSTGPMITGPSFLGLGTPAGGTGSGRGGAQGDGQADRGHDVLRPSSNVDYLLEDDEEPRRSRGKFILVVLALALAVGFGYLHWKRGGFDWLNAGEKKPSAATAPAPEAAPSATDSAAKGTPAAGGAAAPAGTSANGTAPAAGAATPAESGSQPPSAAQSSSPAAPAPSAAAPSTPAPSSPAPTPPAQAAAPQNSDQQSAPQSNENNSSAPAAASRAADSDSEKQSIPAEAAPKPVARKPATAKPAAAKPALAKPSAAKPVESVAEAERYIYGRGVPQNCERGMRLLKPAAESNAQAMISMGVMYTTGTCTPRDLPTAYRWFALALHKEPDNQALQDDLQKLWSQMTPPERQLAIKLSQ